eukprot:GHRR01025725.1.p1 GENE.GHRR01025725.1~~GHRR01025725.1.p1  ORF type:complete len:119 (+),score=17.05 GHRR01025725.1:1371-1727(+)
MTRCNTRPEARSPNQYAMLHAAAAVAHQSSSRKQWVPVKQQEKVKPDLPAERSSHQQFSTNSGRSAGLRSCWYTLVQMHSRDCRLFSAQYVTTSLQHVGPPVLCLHCCGLLAQCLPYI